jgi:hypothetical protein
MAREVKRCPTKDKMDRQCMLADGHKVFGLKCHFMDGV